MSIFRVHDKTGDFTIMSNYHLRDKNLSLKAKGLLSWMLSNKEDWDYSIAGIVACCKEGETTVNTALRELQKYRYVVITKVKPDSDNNRIHYMYDVYEKPQDIESLGVESLALESQELENQAQINTKQTKTNKINTNKDKSISKDIDNSDFQFGTNKTSTKNSSLSTEWFINNYHSMCVSLPKIRAITDKRKKAIAKIMKSYSKEEILEVFTLAESSDFLKGNNDRGWKADIDFILREDKFARILEGGYSSKKQSKKRFQNEGISIPYTKEDRIRDEEFRKEMRANGESTIF